MPEDLSDFLSDLLDITSPFKINSTTRDENGAVHIYIEIDHTYRPDRFSTIHSYSEKTWRHLDIMQYECYLHCRLPMWQDKRTRKCKLMEVPWARPASGFTLLLEQAILSDVKRFACKKTVAERYNLYPQRVETLYDNYTLKAFELRSARLGEAIQLDETSTRKGHNYISTFWDAKSGELLDIRSGRSSQVIIDYVEELEAEGLNPRSNIKEVVCDMSPAFQKGLTEQLPDTAVTFDRFHIVQLMYRHADRHLRQAGQAAEELRAHIRELDQVWQQATMNEAAAFLCFWLDQMEEKFNIPKIGRAIRKYFDGIVRFAKSGITNGPLEGLNSKIQWLRRTARGYRNDENLMRMIYFVFGALKQPYQPLS